MNFNKFRNNCSSSLFLLIVLLTLIDAFYHFLLVPQITVVAIVLFLALEFFAASRTAQINAIILITIGISVAISASKLESIITGFERSRMFLVMFFAVNWLQIPASKSPSLNRARLVITGQPSGRRFIVIAAGVHGLGAVLNLAGLSLVASMMKKTRSLELRKRFAMALMIGFTSASCWSPFYISVVVVLMAIPSINLLDVAPFGFGIALTSILVGWAFDRLKFSTSRSVILSSASPMCGLEYLNVVSLLGVLALLVISLIYFTDISIPIALGLITPVFSMIWWWSMCPVRSGGIHNRLGLAKEVFRSLANLRNEALVFVAATVFGFGVSSAISETFFSEFLDQFLPFIEIRIACLTFGLITLGVIGIHPVVTVIFIGEFLPPEILGLEDWVMGLALLSVWGLSTIVNPYSATTLYISRVGKISPFVMAWRWNLPVCLLTTTLVTGIIIILSDFSSA